MYNIATVAIATAHLSPFYRIAICVQWARVILHWSIKHVFFLYANTLRPAFYQLQRVKRRAQLITQQF